LISAARVEQRIRGFHRYLHAQQRIVNLRSAVVGDVIGNTPCRFFLA